LFWFVNSGESRRIDAEGHHLLSNSTNPLKKEKNMRRVDHGASFASDSFGVSGGNIIPTNAVAYGYLLDTLKADPQPWLKESPEIIEGLTKLGETMRSAGDESSPSDVPAAYTYFGQFVDHDLTMMDFPRPPGEPASCDFTNPKFGPLSDLSAITNQRASFLQLDVLYNGLPPRSDGRMVLGVTTRTDSPILCKDQFNDVPRSESHDDKHLDRVALIGDPRNDNNLIVSQMHVAFLRAHNSLITRGYLLADAKKILRQHYHWVLIHDFLKRIADPAIVEDVLTRSDPLCDPDAPGFCLPVEFTGAAYRFGHSMVRTTYYFNERLPGISFGGLIPIMFMVQANTPTLPDTRIIQWELFVGDPDVPNSNFARRMSTTLNTPLFSVRDANGEPLKCEIKLAVMDLLRGYMLKLPTGQAIARELNARGRKVAILTPKQIEDVAANSEQRDLLRDPAFEFSERTPLWFYILAEAAYFAQGNHLGPVGSTIVAEVLIALVRRSPDPILPKAGESFGDKGFVPFKTPSGDFRLVDLLRLGKVL